MRTIKSMAAAMCIMSAIMANAADSDTREWVDVTLDTPGSLGVEVLYKVDKLSDVKHLRVNGPVNSDDWVTIKNMSAIVSLDLSGTNATAVPQSQFYNYIGLNYILLPPTLTSIGDNAFRNTGIAEVTIPASVKSIGTECFRESKSLVKTDFESGSRLTYIGERSFYRCSALTAIAIPDGVTAVPGSSFCECSSLAEVKLPASVTSIGDYAFYRTALQLIDLPDNLTTISNDAFNSSGLTSVVIPDRVSSMGSGCFCNCSQLTDITLPASMHSYGSQFYNCPALARITCRTATPPAIAQNNDPFSGCTKANVTLTVPEFAVVNFKLHSYWLKFGKIEGGVSSSYWDINESLSLTNNRRMEGTPSVNLALGAQLTVGGNAPMPLDILTLNMAPYDYYGNASFAQMINNSPGMTANNVRTNLSMMENRWYFITMPYDVDVKDVTHSSSSASFIFRYYDGTARAANGTGRSWTNVPADGVLTAGQGYIVQTNTRGTLYMPANAAGRKQVFDPNARTVSLAENVSDNAANAGWNFVGNPFTSYYDMYYTMLTCPVTVWNMRNNNYTAYSLIDDNVVLSPGETFFIQAADGVKSIDFGTLGRQFTSEVSRVAAAPAFGPEGSGRYLFNLTLSCNGLADASRVVINDDASLGYEPVCDAAKFFSDDAAVAQLYTIDAAGNQLAINERPEDDAVVKIGLYAPGAGRMSFVAGRIDGEAVLHDALTGADIRMTEGSVYEFDVDAAGTIDDRFTLTARKPAGTTGVDSVAAGASAAVKSQAGAIAVEGAEGLNLDIYTVDGRVVMSRSISSDMFTVDMPAGMYIVKVGDITTKCIVK